MSQLSCSEGQPSTLGEQADKVILITSGLRDCTLAEDLREEIRHSGLNCEIVRGNVSDPTHILKLIHDVLGCLTDGDAHLNDIDMKCDFLIGKMTDEEWLAQ